jgi:hypothetical protein
MEESTGHRSGMKVSNIAETSSQACRCGSWLAHWNRFSGKGARTFCAEATCAREPAFGALVRKLGSGDPAAYVVPFCAAHHRDAGEIEIEFTTLVSTDLARTCG